MKPLLIMLALQACTTADFYSGPEFEWVEPQIFQQNLEVCRRQVYCNAADLFDG